MEKFETLKGTLERWIDGQRDSKGFILKVMKSISELQKHGL